MRRRRVSKRELLRRIEALEQRLGSPTPAPLDGQQTLDLEVATHPAGGAPSLSRAVQPPLPRM